MTAKIRISPRIAVIVSALSSELGQTTVWDNEPAKADAARRLRSVGQIKALRTEIVQTKKTLTHGVRYVLEDRHDQVLFREQVALHMDLQVAYRLLARSQQKEQPKAEAAHRRTIARLHAEQEALNAADEARRAPSRAA